MTRRTRKRMTRRPLTTKRSGEAAKSRPSLLQSIQACVFSAIEADIFLRTLGTLNNSFLLSFRFSVAILGARGARLIACIVDTTSGKSLVAFET